MSSPFLVIGGTGRTGRSIVTKLLQRGYAVRILTRHAAIDPALKAVGTEVIPGNITDAASVTEAMQGVAGVVIIVESGEQDHGPNNPHSVHFEGTQHVLAAASPQTQIVLVTQIYITRADRYPEVRSIIHWRGQAEAAVRASGQPYTIVRPSWLTNKPGGQAILHFEQNDTGEGQVSREDVAEICVQALLQPTAQGKTFEVYAQPGTPPDDWARVFSKLVADKKIS
jgi:uncharacterized protein YbjT (DUF2867 family)